MKFSLKEFFVHEGGNYKSSVGKSSGMKSSHGSSSSSKKSSTNVQVNIGEEVEMSEDYKGWLNGLLGHVMSSPQMRDLEDKQQFAKYVREEGPDAFDSGQSPKEFMDHFFGGVDESGRPFQKGGGLKKLAKRMSGSNSSRGSDIEKLFGGGTPYDPEKHKLSPESLPSEEDEERAQAVSGASMMRMNPRTGRPHGFDPTREAAEFQLERDLSSYEHPFTHLQKKLKGKKGVEDPSALAAWIKRKELGEAIGGDEGEWVIAYDPTGHGGKGNEKEFLRLPSHDDAMNEIDDLSNPDNWLIDEENGEFIISYDPTGHGGKGNEKELTRVSSQREAFEAIDEMASEECWLLYPASEWDEWNDYTTSRDWDLEEAQSFQYDSIVEYEDPTSSKDPGDSKWASPYSKKERMPHEVPHSAGQQNSSDAWKEVRRSSDEHYASNKDLKKFFVQPPYPKHGMDEANEDDEFEEMMKSIDKGEEKAGREGDFDFSKLSDLDNDEDFLSQLSSMELPSSRRSKTSKPRAPREKGLEMTWDEFQANHPDEAQAMRRKFSDDGEVEGSKFKEKKSGFLMAMTPSGRRMFYMDDDRGWMDMED